MERFCADPVARSVNHPPPSRGRGQPVSRCHWSGTGAAGRVSERAKTCCKCLNCCHNKQLWQQLPPFLVVNATTANTALVQTDERRREPGAAAGSLALGAGGGGRPPMVGGWSADGSRSGMVSGGRGGRADAIRRNRPPAVTPPPLPLFPLSIAFGPAGVLRAFLHPGKASGGSMGYDLGYYNRPRPQETRAHA